MRVLVEGLDADAIGLTERQLQTDVELKLRTAGVKLDDSVGHFLYLNVNVLHSAGRATYCIGLAFEQRGTFDGGFRGFGTTWDTLAVGTVGEARAARYVREHVGDLVDMFLNDYLKANPRH